MRDATFCIFLIPFTSSFEERWERAYTVWDQMGSSLLNSRLTGTTVEVVFMKDQTVTKKYFNATDFIKILLRVA